MPNNRGRRRRQVEALDDFLSLTLIASAQHEAAGRLTDQRIAHVREPLAREAELNVVLAALARIELGLRSNLRTALSAMPFIIIETLDRLVGLAKALRVVGPHRFRHVAQVIGPEKEIARQNVAPEQIHHLGLPVGRG